MASDHYEIRFSGSGGQGMMLMGDIMARAAGINDGKEILLTKSYGPEARGGACRSELIIDTKPINYPALVMPNLVLAMTQLACDSYAKDLKAGGILLLDKDLVKNIPNTEATVYAIPMTDISEKVTGKKISANVVALGAIAVLSGQVSEQALQECIMRQFPPAAAKANEQAFEAGANAARELLH